MTEPPRGVLSNRDYIRALQSSCNCGYFVTGKRL